MEQQCVKCKVNNSGKIVIAEDYIRNGITLYKFSQEQARVFICDSCIKSIYIKNIIGINISGIAFILLIASILIEQFGVYNFAFIKDGYLNNFLLFALCIFEIGLIIYLGRTILLDKYRNDYLVNELNNYAQRVAIKRKKSDKRK